MNRADFLKSSALVAGASMLKPSAIDADDEKSDGHKPNILLIMADDLGYECLGANGSLSYETPHLDKLAADGMRFTNCYSTPICTPSRVQLMTGRYNFRNYVRFRYLDPREITFANMLERAGYKTAISGKWQLGSGLKGPFMAGFNDYCLWQMYRAGMGSRYQDPTIYENGRLRTDLAGAYGPDVLSDFLVSFMKKQRDQPFLAYYPMTLPHDPFVETPLSKVSHQRKRRGRFGERGNKAYFKDMVFYMDSMVGKMRQALDDLGLANNTLMLFFADNGCHPSIVSKTTWGKVRGGKGRTSKNGTHVPLIAYWPGKIKAGRITDELVDLTDFLPTFLEMTGLSPPYDVELDGQSFLKLLLDNPGYVPREWIYCYYDPKWRHWTRRKFAQDKTFKLYSTGEFYNIRKDPRERRSLHLRRPKPIARQARKKLKMVFRRFR